MRGTTKPEAKKIQYYISASIDLSGGAVGDTVLVHAETAGTVKSLTWLYQEASSTDVGIAIDVGEEGDDDAYLIANTEVSKAAWYEKSQTLLKTTLAAGQSITYNSAGGKAGTGTVHVIVGISWN